MDVMTATARSDTHNTTLLVGLYDFSVWTVDAVTLQAQTQITSRSPDIRLLIPTPDGTRVLILLPGANGRIATLESIPLVHS